MIAINFFITSVYAQDDQAANTEVEEITVTGSQIKGAKITGALPVTVITSDDIEGLGIESGEELMLDIAENGTNNFNQSDFNGGYNANRGDVGSLNLRNIGTGNTLTLLNGRRIVNAPSYATEFIGGSYIPVQSVNSNVIPVYGTDRIEILRDGASAIYGADAVAGVVNTVLKDNYEGLTVRLRNNSYENFDAKDQKLSIQFGKNLSNGANISIYVDHYDRDRIRGIEDPKWSDGDFRKLFPADDSPIGQFNDTTWRNMSISSQWAQFYESDGSNIFAMYMPDDSKCTADDPTNQYTIPGQDNMCLVDSSTSRDHQRVSYGQYMDKRGELQRTNLLLFYNTTLDNGIDAYTEIGYYTSDINRVLYPGTFLGSGSSAKKGGATQPFKIPATNYWVSQLQRADGSSFVDKETVTHLWSRYFRFQESRGYDSKRETFRFLQGFSGNFDEWAWDTAVVWSEATSHMDNFGRVDMNALEAAVALTTPDAFNPFCAGVNCNDESIYTTIFRDNKSKLLMWDFKISNPALFSLPAGDAGMLIGVELRKESMTDLRDPNINGEITWTTHDGRTFPYVSNISNSSPSPNTYGSRLVTSIFAEVQMPLSERADAQIAVRAENFDDIGDTLVGKFAVGWQALDSVKFRASTSTSFRAPNLITVNEGFIVRSNTLSDPLLEAGYGSEIDSYSIQRAAQGNQDLESEEATNYSIGLVIEPINNMIITIDKWEIKTEDTVGLFGEANHMLLDTLIRKQGGASECTGNPLVIRGPAQSEEDDDGNAMTWDSSMCPAGRAQTVMDTYINLDDRTMEGTDIAIQYSAETRFGRFSAKIVNVHYNKFYQEASGVSAQLIEASQPGGPLSGLNPPKGFSDLLGIDGKPEDKTSMNLSWKKGPYEVFISGTKVGSFFETAVSDNAKRSGIYACSGTSSYDGPGCGDYWLIESMTTYNITLGYKFENGLRLRGSIRNVENTRAPLADEYTWGAWSDVHSDYGKSYAIELYKKFN